MSTLGSEGSAPAESGAVEDPGGETIVKVANRPSAGGLLVLLLGFLAPAATAEDGHATVNCFDESLGTVHRTLASDCRGRPVSGDEAASIRQQRRDYIQKVLAKPPHPDVAGMQLAGLGSGFFVAPDGSVVTSHHVIESCAAVSITPTFGEMRLATAVAEDPKTDLALLRSDITPPGIASIVAGAGPAIIGSAYVIGYPNKGMVTIEPILTTVEVIGRESNSPKGPAIVLRGDIRRGNSGGPLLDTGGSVLGVVFAKVDSVTVYQTTSQVVQEIGLASPGDILTTFLSAQGVDYRVGYGRPPQPVDRIMEDLRPFMAQIGCWK